MTQPYFKKHRLKTLYNRLNTQKNYEGMILIP